MAPSTNSLSSEETEHECFSYVVNKIHKYQPISLPALHGFMSCIAQKAKPHMGTTTLHLLTYLKGHPEIFKFERGKICLLAHPKKFGVSVEDDCSTNSDDSYPDEITDGEGKISRLFPKYGFLTIDHPPAIDTAVYFSEYCFRDSGQLLNEFLRVGQKVAFSAKKAKRKNPTALYCANTVWIHSDNEEEEDKVTSNNLKSNQRARCKTNGLTYTSETRNKFSTKNTKKYIPTRKKKITTNTKSTIKENFEEGDCHHHGILQNIFDNFGFISFKETKDRVFFHINKVVDCPSGATNLSKVCKLGNTVEFTCIPSKKQKDNVKWEAVKVWLNANKHEMSGDEIFESSSDISNEDSVSTLSLDGNHSLQKSSIFDQSEIKGFKGKIYPNNDNTAEIKCMKLNTSVIAENCLFYINGEKIVELMWHFEESDDVLFDAVKKLDDDNEPYWMATHVWIGKPPTLFETEESNVKQSEDKSPSSTNRLARYNSWGDSPMEGEIIGKNSPTDKQEVDENNCSNSPEIKTQSLLPDLKVRKTSVESIKDDDRNCANNTVDNEVQTKSFDTTPGVYMFEGLETEIVKVYRHVVQVSCSSLRKPMSFLVAEMYWKGKLLSDTCSDPRSTISEGDLVYINGFEVITDQEFLWQKVILAWVGEKPKGITEMEPSEFLLSQNLEVSVEIPTWKQFRKSVDKKYMLEKSMRSLNNDSTAVTSEKFLSTVKKIEKNDSNDIEDVTLKMDAEMLSTTYDGVPDSLIHEFGVTRNIVNRLRQKFSSFKTVKEYDELASQLEHSIQSVVNHVRSLNLPNGTVSSVESDVCDQKHVSSTRPTKSVAVQTFITGNVVARDVFPQ